MKLVVLASGRGSNFEAIARAAAQGALPDTQILALICNKPGARVMQIAEQFKIPVHLHASAKVDRAQYEKSLIQLLKRLGPDYVCLAGYMLILGKAVIDAFSGKIINIHPSLLPAFRGLHAQRQAIEAKVEWTGCTVHLVTEELDAGPILAQTVLKVEKGDTEETLTDRLLPLEHRTYVDALKALAVKPVR